VENQGSADKPRKRVTLYQSHIYQSRRFSVYSKVAFFAWKFTKIKNRNNLNTVYG